MDEQADGLEACCGSGSTLVRVSSLCLLFNTAMWYGAFGLSSDSDTVVLGEIYCAVA